METRAFTLKVHYSICQWCVRLDKNNILKSVQPFNRRMNRHRSDLTKKTLLPVSEHFVSPWHSLDVFGRSKMYIIDHNPSLKENQRQKRESFWIRELRTLHPEGITEKA